MTVIVEDDLGVPVERSLPARRVVSLVPSLTEAIASVDQRAIVGATDWCTHPPDLTCARIRCTKNPDVRAIVKLSPDVVIANKEENRELDIHRLRDAGVPVWVTDIETVEQSFSSLERMFDHALGWPRPVWMAEAGSLWSVPPPEPTLRVVVPIWRDPWMVVGPATFTGDLLRRLGCEVLPRSSDSRYPAVDVTELDRAGADLVLLPDEPYVFSGTDGPEAFATTPTQLVNGRLLTWYGPSLVPARPELLSSLAPWRSMSR